MYYTFLMILKKCKKNGAQFPFPPYMHHKRILFFCVQLIYRSRRTHTESIIDLLYSPCFILSIFKIDMGCFTSNITEFIFYLRVYSAAGVSSFRKEMSKTLFLISILINKLLDVCSIYRSGAALYLLLR